MHRTAETRAAALTTATLGLAVLAGMLSGLTGTGAHPHPEPQAAPVAPAAHVAATASAPLVASRVESVRGRTTDRCLPAAAATIRCPSEPLGAPAAGPRSAWTFAYQTGVTPPTFRTSPFGRRITVSILHP